MYKLLMLLVTFLFIYSIVLSQPGDINEDEKNSIFYMAEEEKLARDVYQYFSVRYDIPVFKNITKSENWHMQMVKSLADTFQIELSPQFTGNIEGEFENEVLQKKYTELTEKGSKSLLEALSAGALIEEMDIKDLESGLEASENALVRSVYTRLVNASENHLRAFVNNLEFRGVTYKPVHLNEQRFLKAMEKNEPPMPGTQ